MQNFCPRQRNKEAVPHAVRYNKIITPQPVIMIHNLPPGCVQGQEAAGDWSSSPPVEAKCPRIITANYVEKPTGMLVQVRVWGGWTTSSWTHPASSLLSNTNYKLGPFRSKVRKTGAAVSHFATRGRSRVFIF